jgi:hypothetical protein
LIVDFSVFVEKRQGAEAVRLSRSAERNSPEFRSERAA